jgi:hypothetical protein
MTTQSPRERPVFLRCTAGAADRRSVTNTDRITAGPESITHAQSGTEPRSRIMTLLETYRPAWLQQERRQAAAIAAPTPTPRRSLRDH